MTAKTQGLVHIKNVYVIIDFQCVQVLAFLGTIKSKHSELPN